MRNRHAFKIILIVIVGFILFSQVYANTNDVGIIDVKSRVINGFDGSISVNYFDTKGYNVLIKLDKTAGYKFKGKIPVGKYKLDAIDVAKGYKVEINKAFEVKAGKLTILNLVIDKVVVENTGTKKPAKTLEKTPVVELIPDEKAKKDIPITEKSANKNTDKKSSTNAKDEDEFKVGNTGIYTIIILVILVLLVLIKKFKKNKNY